MMRLRSLAVAVLLVTAGAGITACGGNTVANDSCPDAPGADGSAAYYAEPGTNGTAVGQQIPQMPHSHVPEGTRVQYEHNPPTSGCHYIKGDGGNNPAPIPAGVYTRAVDAEFWVHNLEHGYIVVVYDCSGGAAGCPGDVARLRQWVASLKPDPKLVAGLGQQAAYAKVVVVPWSKPFGHRFAALSWDWFDPMDSVDTNELQRFYDNHVDQSPEEQSSGGLSQ